MLFPPQKNLPLKAIGSDSRKLVDTTIGTEGLGGVRLGVLGAVDPPASPIAAISAPTGMITFIVIVPLSQ
jgi:hypothetical protein